MATTAPNAILANRDSNTQLSPQKLLNNQRLAIDKPLKQSSSGASLQRKMLESRLQNGASTENGPKDEKAAVYISPSDNITSPATQKLNAFKSKQALKKSKPTTLFKAHSMHRSSSSLSAGNTMFADIPPKST